MLIQEDLDPADENYHELETITKETLRCRKIVSSLLDFARQSEPSKKENDINEIIRDSIVLTNKQAAFNDVALAHELTADIPLVFVDKGQIEQAIINLIINAVEATDSGGAIKVSSSFKPGDDHVAVRIIDNGSGISSDDIDRLFDPFFTTKEEGTGLGLAITHGIIEQHNGTIDVDSRLGRGTTFQILLPVTG
jgi:signal transduction histidine kinase